MLAIDNEPWKHVGKLALIRCSYGRFSVEVKVKLLTTRQRYGITDFYIAAINDKGEQVIGSYAWVSSSALSLID